MKSPFSAPHSRRRFLGRAAAASAASALAAFGTWPRRASGASGSEETVSILHTTDLHGHILPTRTYDGIEDVGGLARCATQIRRWREESPQNLLVDLGDLYQGTAVGHATEGRVMVDALNLLRYDAWVMGNHEFDWGLDPVESAVSRSEMPVLAANTTFHGADSFAADPEEAGAVRPFIVRELAGYRIVFVGLMTPGMPNWFLPEALPGYGVHDPVEVLAGLMPRIESLKPDALVLGTHMGIRPWSRADDAANRLDALTKRFGGVDLVLAGHTHREFAATRVNGVPYSQALYFGICAGRADLVFDRETRRLLRVDSQLRTMDATVPMDPAVLDLARDALDSAEEALARPVGRLRETLGIRTGPGRPSEVERLIGTAMIAGLRAKGEAVDAAVHGLLYADGPFEAGEKTVRDLWGVIPFENQTLVAELLPAELAAILEDVYSIRNLRSLIGLQPVIEGPRSELKVVGIRDAEGREVPGDRRLRVAFNSYDAASGGGRFDVVREILARPETRRRLLPYQTRSLLIEFFSERESVGVEDLI